MEQQNTKIDGNQIAGFILIAVIMLGFGWWQSKNAPEVEATTSTEQVQESATTVDESTLGDGFDLGETTPSDTTMAAADSTAFVAENITLENTDLKLTFSTKGARLLQAELKGYHTYDSLPVQLVNGSQQFDLTLPDGRVVSGQEFSLESNSATSAVFVSGDLKVSVALPEAGFDLSYLVSGNSGAAGKPRLVWDRTALRTEKGVSNERIYSSFAYKLKEDGDIEHLAMRGGDKEKTVEPTAWLAQKQHFFSYIVHPEAGFDQSELTTQNGDKEDELHIKRYKAVASVDQTIDGPFTLPFSIYLGPNHYQTLKKYDQGYHKVIQFGWGIFGWIGRGVVVPIFNWLDGFGLNYGVIILIMVLIIKFSLAPLTFASYRSQAKMRVLKPQLDKINEKFGDKDQVAKQQAQMNLYREAGVNPLGGCIPALIQMPILFAMFRFFPSLIELRGEGFLWATDLSTYDDLIHWDTHIPILSTVYGNHISIFTLLMTVSTIIYTRMNQQMTASTGNSAQMKQIQTMMYLMPLIFMFALNSYPAGLTYYYFLSNVTTFALQWGHRQMIDDEAILAKLEAKKAQPKKQSKFQARLEEMQRQSNATRAQRRK